MHLLGVGDVVIDVPQEDRVTAAFGKAGVLGRAFDHGHVLDPGVAHGGTDLADALGVDLRRENVAFGSHHA